MLYYLMLAFLAVIVVFFVAEEYRQVKKLNVVRRLIDTYEHDVENPRLIDEMYDFCQKDRRLKKVMQKHQPTREDFDKLYHKLLILGNFRKYNRFIPISSFFAVYTLDYLLTHKDEDHFKLTKKCMNFFNF